MPPGRQGSARTTLPPTDEAGWRGSGGRVAAAQRPGGCGSEAGWLQPTIRMAMATKYCSSSSMSMGPSP